MKEIIEENLMLKQELEKVHSQMQMLRVTQKKGKNSMKSIDYQKPFSVRDLKKWIKDLISINLIVNHL